MVMASTKDIDTRGATAALNHITKEIPEAYKYAQIVGCNLLEVEAQSESDEVAVTDKSIAEELKRTESLSKFISTYQLEDGQSIFIFYSKSANSLVKINASEMKAALNGGRPRFSFIESEVNDQGFIKFTAVKKEGADYAAAENNIGNEFKEATMSKKYQVDKFKFGVNEDFTSPIDGVTYKYEEGKTHPYMQYLSDSGQFAGEARTEGVGHNSILAVDTVPNANGSVFHDVNIKFGPVGVKNATAEKAADVAANSVVTTALPKTSSTPAAATVPVAPSNAVDIEALLAESQKLVEGKTADEQFYIIGGELYKRMTNVLPDGFDGDSSLYENSRIAGNTVDEIVKKFFDEGDTTKPEGISQGAFNMLMTKLQTIKAELDAKGGRYITRNLVVYDKESKVAGEIDILAVDKDGNYMIYDVKTGKLKSWESYSRSFGPGQLTKKEKHQFQVSGYAYLFNKMLGLSVKKLGIMPFEINYDADGNITSLFNRPGIPVSYAPRIEKMIKDAGPEGPAPAAPAAPSTPAPASVGFETLGNIGNQGLAIMETDINKSGKHLIPNISKATPEQRQKIDSNIEELKKKYPAKNITSRIAGDTMIVEINPAVPVTPTVPGPPATTPVVASTDGLVAPKTNSAFFGSKKNVVTSQPTTGGVKVVSMGGGAVDISALPDDMLAAMGNQSLESMIANLDTSGENIQEICKPK